MAEPAEHPRVGPAAHHAAGVKGVAVAMRHALGEMGPARTFRTFKRINQADGFDCMSCAWPDPDPEHRHGAEFCENGAKAVAHEATKDRIGAEFFGRHSLEDLRQRDDYWLGKQGRLTEPLVKTPGDRHYRPISWPDAFALIAEHLTALDSPDEAVFYTSGRASNEAAFAYQLFVRAFGTNNLPDCSNMCHESSGVALVDAIGIGKGSVSLSDIYGADLIVLAGQNPGTNHPRMLSALEIAKRRGATIVAINPLREAGSTNFRNPQRPRGIVGKGTDLADLHLPVRLGSDRALFQAVGHLLLKWDAIDHDFVGRYTRGFIEWRAHLEDLDWDLVTRRTGIDRSQIEEFAHVVRDSKATIWCWAMGLTQHHDSVATIREVVNLALARGDIGKPGAGLCPVRGHSNVQGDRTMGIWEKPPESFLDALQREFGFEPPRQAGHDTVESIEALLEGRAKVFVGLGGNFVAAAPDTELTKKAMRSAHLTVQISTKLNRSHVECGDTALILPTLGRTERDVQASGPQFITVEDSMSSVHASRGRLAPVSKHVRSEIAIVSDMAAATVGEGTIDWSAMRDDYSVIRRQIAAVIPGFEDFENRVRQPAGFVLPHPPRDSREFTTRSGQAEFHVSVLDEIHVPEGHVLLQTLRSHDQFNTTIYGMDDRYRGIRKGRRVVFVSPSDLADLGLSAGDIVDLIAHPTGDGRVRKADGFRVVPYGTPPGCAAAYYPETNPLVPLTATALASNTPTYKSIPVRLVPRLPDSR